MAEMSKEEALSYAERTRSQITNIRKEGEKVVDMAIGAGEVIAGMVAGGYVNAKGWNLGGYTYDKIGGGVGLLTALLLKSPDIGRVSLGLLAPLFVGLGQKAAGMEGNPLTAKEQMSAGAGSPPRQLHGRNTSAEAGAQVVQRLAAIR